MNETEIAMVIAIDEKGGIGSNGKLPKWKIKDDLEFFTPLHI